MRKVLFMLLLMVLLGAMPRAVWDSGTPEQQKGLIETLGEGYCAQTKCAVAKISVYSEDGMVLFFAECVKRAEEKL